MNEKSCAMRAVSWRSRAQRRELGGGGVQDEKCAWKERGAVARSSRRRELDRRQRRPRIQACRWVRGDDPDLAERYHPGLWCGDLHRRSERWARHINRRALPNKDVVCTRLVVDENGKTLTPQMILCKRLFWVVSN